MSLLWDATAGAAVLALLELDAAAIGPFLLSRPLVVGPLVGMFFGETVLGAGIGVVFETLTLEELPLGGRLELSAALAAGTAVWLGAGPLKLPLEEAFILGLGTGWVHARLERFLRGWRGAKARRAAARVAAGGDARLGMEIFTALTGQALAAFGVCLVVFTAAAPSLGSFWPSIPQAARDGLRESVWAAPWLGAGSLTAWLWRRA